MSKLVNISSDKDKPLFIDARKISCMSQMNGTLYIFYTDASMENFAVRPAIEIHDVVKKIFAEGHDVVFVQGADGKGHFLSPKAISYLSFENVDTDGICRVRAGVQGLGPVELRLTPDELASLRAEIQAAGINMMFIPGREASAWSDCAGLYLDPGKIMHLRDDGAQLIIDFMKTGEMMLALAPIAQEALAARAQKKYPGTPEQAFRRAAGDIRGWEAGARREIAHRIGAEALHLTNVPDAMNPQYIDLNRIEKILPPEEVTLSDGSRIFAFVVQLVKRPARSTPDFASVYFADAAATRHAIDVLSGTVPAPKPAPAINPVRKQP